MREDVELPGGPEGSRLDGILRIPRQAFALYVMAHGAGADMHHAFLEDVAEHLADRSVATLRFQFPYTQAGRRRPDPPAVLEACVATVVDWAASRCPDLPRFAGGKSMGGRMASRAAAGGSLASVQGLVFLGFPLHPAGKPSVDRAAHLERLAVPLLFLQGTRDRLADPTLLRSALASVQGHEIHWVEAADHGFSVPKRSGRTQTEVMNELCDRVAAWMEQALGPRGASSTRG